MGALEGLDDLEVDGNWAPATANDPAVRAEAKNDKTAKRKRSASGAVDDAIEEIAVPAQTVLSKNVKKRRRRAAAAAAKAQAQGTEGPCQRLAASWAAEAKSSSLSTLEVKEIVPNPDWCLSCASAARLAQLPWQLDAASSSSSVLSAVRDRSVLPTTPAAAAAVVVLCASTDRVFEAVVEVQDQWRTKPLALAAYGGGRKKDQIARQAETLRKGVPVALATPGRLLRLLDEGHMSVDGVEVVVLDLTRDPKNRDLLTLPETRRDFFALLQRHFRKSLEAPGGLRFVLCAASGS